MHRRFFLAASAASLAITSFGADAADGSPATLTSIGDASAPVMPGTAHWMGAIDDMSQPALRVAADFPGSDLSLMLLLRRNNDKSLPADAIFELDFKPGSGVIESLQDVGLKRTQAADATRLIGASARIRGSEFLLALSAATDDSAHNRRLLHRGDWLTIDFTYADGRQSRASLGIGNADRKLIDTALDSWPA